MKYSAPLDGVRAVAILAVLAFHVSPSTVPGGFTGVDVFFVLSGFLITSIILHDLREHAFSFREFYARRVQRLLPNAVVTVLATLILWKVFLPPSAVAQAARHGVWALFNLSNVYIWRNMGGYWGEAAVSAPLLHTWSLAVEEQFYLLFPFLLVILARQQGRRVTAWIWGTGFLSFGLCVYGMQQHAVPTFYLLPTRVWELLLGAGLASRRVPLVGNTAAPASRLSPAIVESFGWLGLGMIMLGFVFIDESQGFPGWVALVPCTGTALVLRSIADGETRVARLLSAPGMVLIGKLSYSLYLWHWPLITLGRMEADVVGIPSIVGAAAGGFAGVVLAVVAYWVIEQPMRRRGPGRVWRLGVIAGAFVAVLGVSGLAASRATLPPPSPRFDRPTFSGFAYSAGNVADPNPALKAARYADVLFPPLPARASDPWREGGIIHRHGGASPDIVVLGSSHALMYSPLLDDLCRELGLSVAFLGVDGTPVFFNGTVNEVFRTAVEAHAFDDARRRWLRQWHPKAVFLIDRWDEQYASDHAFGEALRRFLGEVSPLADRVFFVAQVPVVPVGELLNLREYMAWRLDRGRDAQRLRPDRNQPTRQRTAELAAAARATFPNLVVLRPDLLFVEGDGSIRWSSGRTVFYADDDHLTDIGAEVVRRLFQDALVDATRAQDLRVKGASSAVVTPSTTSADEAARARR